MKDKLISNGVGSLWWLDDSFVTDI